jgi:hypothetical protein
MQIALESALDAANSYWFVGFIIPFPTILLQGAILSIFLERGSRVRAGRRIMEDNYIAFG